MAQTKKQTPVPTPADRTQEIIDQEYTNECARHSDAIAKRDLQNEIAASHYKRIRELMAEARQLKAGAQ